MTSVDSEIQSLLQSIPKEFPNTPHINAKEKVLDSLEHTLLNPKASKKDYMILFEQALKFQLFGICVPPTYISLAKENLKAAKPKIVTVIGFPNGYNTTQSKVFEAQEAEDLGADEIDMVLNVSWLKQNEHSKILEDISLVVDSTNVPIKVIIETGLLTDKEKMIASYLVQKSGAHFVKTCSGFNGGAATVEDIKLIKWVVKNEVGIKASGGIKNLNSTIDLLSAGATRIGTSSGHIIAQEL